MRNLSISTPRRDDPRQSIRLAQPLVAAPATMSLYRFRELNDPGESKNGWG
jgi:hypothetical protein